MAQATLNGQLVFDGGESCTCWFEWGTSRSYGFETPKQGRLTTGTMFSDTIYNLAEGVLYHYRAVAQNTAYVVYGNDQVFVISVGSTIPILVDDAVLLQLLEVT